MSDPRTELLNDHAEAERLLHLLEQSVEGNDCCADLRAVWSKVEAMLLDHMRTEERFLFAHVADAHRAELEVLRAEHVLIRAALSKLGVELDLHSLRKPEVEALTAFVRRHAELENRTLYRWLAEKPEAGFQAAVHRMIRNRAKPGEADDTARRT